MNGASWRRLREGTECGTVCLSVEGDDERLLFRVADTGPGIAPEARSLIFERFVQVDGSNTRRVGGLGMGLALSRGLADRLGCELTLETTSDQGSCFLLRVPMAVVRVESVETPAPVADCLRVLVVDDNDINRQVLLTLLKEFGLEGCAVPDGAAAVDAWTAETWDAILMDINMPVMDGVDATRAIRAGEVERRGGHVPIIAVTASATPADAASYRAAGMDDVLAKPIDAGRLLESLTRQLEAVQAA